MPKKSGFTLWQERIEKYNSGEPIPETLISSLRTKVARNWQQWPREQFDWLCDAVNANKFLLEWNISEAQTEKGKIWLAKNWRKFPPELRPTVLNVHHFYFDGFNIRPGPYYPYNDVTRVYRVVGIDGKAFCYEAEPWQNGNKTISIFKEKL